MRLVHNENGIGIIVSNEEYLFIKKIAQRKKVQIDTIKDFYQEMGCKLVSRGILNTIEIDNKEYFVPVRRNDEK